MLDALLLTLPALQDRNVFSEATRALKPVTVAEARVELPVTWVRPVVVGDLDGDGIVGVAAQHGTPQRYVTRVLSGADGSLLRELGPDLGRATPVGDLDVEGDGRDDFAVSESRLNLPPPRFDPTKEGHEVFAECTFGELLDMGAMPNTMNSGCLWIVSGRTREPIWVVYGEPSSGLGIGRSVCAVPDVTGDGLPDLIVGGNRSSYLFAGPGR